MKTPTLICSLLLAALPVYGAENLLKNGDFETGKDSNAHDWMFLQSHLPKDPLDAARVHGERAIEPNGNHYLSIEVASPASHIHVFWAQADLPVIGGQKYHLSFRSRGRLKKTANTAYASPTPDVMFRDVNQRWMGAIPVPNMKFTEKWTSHEFTFTAPEDASTMGIRFGLDSLGADSSFSVDDVVLTEVTE